MDETDFFYPMVERTRKSRPDLPDRLTKEQENRVIDEIRSWLHRVQDKRRAIDDGLEVDMPFVPERLSERPRSRTKAFYTTHREPEEQRALNDLWTMLNPYIVSTIGSPKYLTDLDLKDVYQDLYLLFLRVMSTYKPERGDVIPFINANMRSDLKRYKKYLRGNEEYNVMDDIKNVFQQKQDVPMEERAQDLNINYKIIIKDYE